SLARRRDGRTNIGLQRNLGRAPTPARIQCPLRQIDERQIMLPRERHALRQAGCPAPALWLTCREFLRVKSPPGKGCRGTHRSWRCPRRRARNLGPARLLSQTSGARVRCNVWKSGGENRGRAGNTYKPPRCRWELARWISFPVRAVLLSTARQLPA